MVCRDITCRQVLDLEQQDGSPFIMCWSRRVSQESWQVSSWQQEEDLVRRQHFCIQQDQEQICAGTTGIWHPQPARWIFSVRQRHCHCRSGDFRSMDRIRILQTCQQQSWWFLFCCSALAQMHWADTLIRRIQETKDRKWKMKPTDNFYVNHFVDWHVERIINKNGSKKSKWL